MQDGDIDFSALGRAIQRRREMRGWSIYRLSQRAGMSDPYLREIERGNKRRLGVSIIARLAQALGTSTDALLADAGLDVPNLPDVPTEVASIYSALSFPARRAALEHLRIVRELEQRYRADSAARHTPDMPESGEEEEEEEEVDVSETEPQAAHKRTPEEQAWLDEERRRQDQDPA